MAPTPDFAADQDFGSVTNPTTSTVTIEIENTGKQTLRSPNVSFDKSSAPEFTIVNDKVSGSADLNPGASRWIDIKFTPGAAHTAYAGVIVVTSPNLTAPAKLAVTGKG